MTTSSYMSDVKVEIAFTSNFTTPLASFVWTDVSQWVELRDGISIGYGRSDERSQADANTLSLTLDNSDGRFTPDRTASPYYPNVRLYRPIRVTATPPGGTPSVRFTGYINQWPVAWDGADTYARSTLTAASRLSRLGLNDARRSALEETILLDNPFLLYPLGEPEGSTMASDTSEVLAEPLLQVDDYTGPQVDVAFGAAEGPPGDGLTAAVFAPNGRFLGARYGQVLPAAQAVEFWLTTSGQTGFVLTTNFVRVVWSSATVGPFITYDNFEVEWSGSPLTFAVRRDGPPVHVVVTIESGRLRVYTDALEVDSTPAGANTLPTDALSVGDGGNVSLAQVAVYDHGLTATRISRHYSASFNAFLGESSANRMYRYGSYVGIGFSEMDFGGLKHGHVKVDTAGQGVIDLMRQIEVTESAVLYDTRDGHLALVAESVRYTATPAFTLDMAQGQIEADFSPQHDPSTILNDCTVTKLGGSPSARVVNQASRDEYGVATGDYEVTSTDNNLPAQLASWQVLRYAQPKMRVGSVSVDVTAQVGGTPSPDLLLAADIHTLIATVNQPSQAQASSAAYFVEGYTETIAVESHTISFNVSPAEPFTKVFILDDPVRGALDGSYVLGL